jgi:hypothetical protein
MTASLHDRVVYRISQQLLDEIENPRVRQLAWWWLYVMEGCPFGLHTLQWLRDRGHIKSGAALVNTAWQDAIGTAKAAILAYQPKLVDDVTLIHEVLTKAERDALYARIAGAFPAGLEAKVQAVRDAWAAYRDG